MHKIMIYENSIGQRAVLGKNNIIITDSDILDYEWTRSQKFDSVISMKQGRLVANKVKLFCKGEAVADALFRVIDYDAANNQMGKLFLCNYEQDEPNATNYYRVGYFVKSAKGKFHYNSYEEIDLTFLADVGAWYRETTSAYRSSDQIIQAESGQDFPYDYTYDMTQDLLFYELINDDYIPSDFRMVIYGPAEYPTIYINNHPYRVNVAVYEGEKLIIDSAFRKIYKVLEDGEIQNNFENREKSAYIFEKIQPGTMTVSTDSDINFDITLIEKRSEPKWI